MTRRPFGITGLEVPSIGLGLAALGRPGYITLGHGNDLAGGRDPASMEAHAHRILDVAWDSGVRYFDGARSYGRAETFLGSWLATREIPRDQVAVGSKWGYTYTAGWQVQAEQHEVKEHSLAVLQRQWRESLKNLGGAPDLYQIHSATLESGVLTNIAVLNELVRLKADGLCIGLSLSGANQGEVLDRALAVEVDGARLFDAVQATWNLLEPSAGPTLARAHDAGMGVIVKEALANGRLTSRNTDPTFSAEMALLEQQAQRLESTVDTLALAAVLAQPWADVVLSGAASEEHLRSNLAAQDVAWDESAAQALGALVEEPAEYWATRSNLAWN